MDFEEVVRSTFSAREFTDEPIPDETVERLLEQARFAPSGGNRQGWRVIIIRDQPTKDSLAECARYAAQRYAAQLAAGENPWNTVVPTRVTAEGIAATTVPPMLIEPLRRAPVVLVVCVDLRVVASVDQELDRIGIASGASIYPFAWNILLAARNEGLGGTLTTMPIGQELRVKALLGIPEYGAVCAVIPLGRPVRSLSKLKRKPVAAFATHDRWDGASLGAVQA